MQAHRGIPNAPFFITEGFQLNDQIGQFQQGIRRVIRPVSSMAGLSPGSNLHHRAAKTLRCHIAGGIVPGLGYQTGIRLGRQRHDRVLGSSAASLFVTVEEKSAFIAM